jgi:hypothetical protein
LGDRAKMMQQWADMLDTWKKGDDNVTPIKKAAAYGRGRFYLTLAGRLGYRGINASGTDSIVSPHRLTPLAFIARSP